MGVVELVVASVHLPRAAAKNIFCIFSSLDLFLRQCYELCPPPTHPGLAVLISSADAQGGLISLQTWNLSKNLHRWIFRAPETGFLNAFQQPASVFRARRQQQQQQPGVLGCLTACTRELRPVRGHQGGREKILPNPCTFQAAQCQARRTRGPPLIKDPNQDDVTFPSI